jgi:hypothetical protein
MTGLDEEAIDPLFVTNAKQRSLLHVLVAEEGMQAVDMACVLLRAGMCVQLDSVRTRFFEFCEPLHSNLCCISCHV